MEGPDGPSEMRFKTLCIADAGPGAKLTSHRETRDELGMGYLGGF